MAYTDGWMKKKKKEDGRTAFNALMTPDPAREAYRDLLGQRTTQTSGNASNPPRNTAVDLLMGKPAATTTRPKTAGGSPPQRTGPKSIEVINGTNVQGWYAPGVTPARMGTGPSADMTGRDVVSMLLNRRRTRETLPSGATRISDLDPLVESGKLDIVKGLLPQQATTYRTETTEAGAAERERLRNKNALELERLRQGGLADQFNRQHKAAMELAKLETRPEGPTEKVIFDDMGQPVWVEDLVYGTVTPHPVAARKAFNDALENDGPAGAARELEKLSFFRDENAMNLGRLLLTSRDRATALQIARNIRNPDLQREAVEIARSLPDPIQEAADEIKGRGIVGRTADAVTGGASKAVEVLAGDDNGRRGPLSEGSRARQNIEAGLKVGQYLDPFGLGRLPRKGAQFWLSLPRYLKTAWDYWSARPENKGRSFEEFEADYMMGGADVAMP